MLGRGTVSVKEMEQIDEQEEGVPSLLDIHIPNQVLWESHTNPLDIILEIHRKSSGHRLEIHRKCLGKNSTVAQVALFHKIH